MEPSSPYMFSQVHGLPQMEKRGRSQMGVAPGWFYLRLMSVLNASYKLQLERNNVFLGGESRVDAGWYKQYFDEEQLSFLKNQKSISLFPLQKSFKASKSLLSLGAKDKYLIEAAPNWKPAENGTKFRHFRGSFYVVDENANPNMLMSDPKIAFITKMPKRRQLNRFTSGFLQSGDQNAEFFEGSLTTPRSMHKRGLNGHGQVITVVDSGVDRYHPFFYDPNHQVTLGGVVGEHRKIMTIFNQADAKDVSGGHGTHVCGTALGEAFCGNCSVGLYNGVAPKAKLAMVDIGFMDEGSSMSGDFDLDDITQRTAEIGSFVCSNSWGSDENCALMSWMYNYETFISPDTLFVFAAGNSGREIDLSCPSDARTILSVGATTKTWLAKIHDGNAKITVECGSQQISVNKARNSVNVLDYNLGGGRPIYQCQPAFTTDSNLKGKVFISLEGSSEEIWKAISKGAEAVITHGDRLSSWSSVPVVYVSSFNDYAVIAAMKNITIVTRPSNNDQRLDRASFSSRGPAYYNGLKPDIVIPGSMTYSSSAGNPNSDVLRSTNFDSIITKSGTSMATPAASGLAAIIRQFFVEGWYPDMEKGKGDVILPSSYLLRALFIASCRPISGTDKRPNHHTGYGHPILENIFPFDGSGLRIIDHVTIAPKSRHSYNIHVDKGLKPLVVTMAYLDYPNHYTSKAPLCSDLDLLVIAPNGQMFKGNGGTEVFTSNERVFIEESQVITGDYEIIVLSNNYPSDVAQANYSLVVTGDFQQSNYTANPRYLQQTQNDKTQLQCVNGEAQTDGCHCNENISGMLCSDSFTEIKLNTFESITLNQREVRHYKVAFDKCDPQYPPTLTVSTRYGTWIHLAFAGFPFQNLYDEGVSHFDEQGGGNLQIDCPINGSVYFAASVTTTSSDNIRLSVLNSKPRQTPKPTELPEATPLSSKTSYPTAPTSVPSSSSSYTKMSPSESLITTTNMEITTKIPLPTDNSMESEENYIVTFSLLLILAAIIGALFIIVLLPRVFRCFKRNKHSEENDDMTEDLVNEDETSKNHSLSINEDNKQTKDKEIDNKTTDDVPIML